MWRTDDFLRQKQAIIKYFKKKGVDGNTISEYCTLSGVPIVVVCEFIKEEMPEHTELCDDKITSINEFFGIRPKKEETCGTCTKKCGNDWCVTGNKDD